MNADSECVRVKGERGGVLNSRQYNIMLAYMKTGVLPSLETLMEANMVDTYYTKHGSGRGRFRSWANRMYLRQSDGHLVHKTTGKIVIPREEWEPTIMAVHCGVASSKNKSHLSCKATYSKIQKKYSMGKQRFGMSEDLVKNVVKSCKTGSCLLKKITDHIDDSDDEYSLKPLLEGSLGTKNENPFLLQDLQLSPTTSATITSPVDSTTVVAYRSLPQMSLCGQQQPYVAVNSSNIAGHNPYKTVTAEEDVHNDIQSNFDSPFVSNSGQIVGKFPSSAQTCPQNLNVNSNFAKYMTLPVLIRAPPTKGHGIKGGESPVKKAATNQSLKVLPKLSCNLPKLCKTSAHSASDCNQAVIMPSTNSSVILPLHFTPFTQTPPVVSYPHVRQRFQVGDCDLVTRHPSGNFYLHNEEKPESATTANAISTDSPTFTLCVIPIQPDSNATSAENSASTQQFPTQTVMKPSTSAEPLSASHMQVDENQPIICSVGSIDQAVWEATSPSSTKACPKVVNKIKDKLKKKLKQSLPPEQFRNCTVKEMLKKQREKSRKTSKSLAKSRSVGTCDSKSLYDKCISKQQNSIGPLKKEQTEKMKDILLKSLHKVKKRKGKSTKNISGMNTCKSAGENLKSETVQDHTDNVNENALNQKKAAPTNRTGLVLNVSTSHSNTLKTVTNSALVTNNHSSASSVMTTYTVQTNNNMEQQGTAVFRMSAPLLTHSTVETFQNIPFVIDAQPSTVVAKPAITQITFPVIQAFPAPTQVVPSTSSTVSSVAYARVVNSQATSSVTQLSSSSSLYPPSAAQTTASVLHMVPPANQNSLSPLSEAIPETTHLSMETDTVTEPVDLALPEMQAEVPLSPGIQSKSTTQKTTTVNYSGNRFVTRSSMKTTPVKKWLGIAPYPDSPPFPQIWHHFDDVRKEKHCYNRLIRVVQDMRMDVMKSVMKDKPAADRLKKKIAYGELLVQQYRSFLSSKRPR